MGALVVPLGPVGRPPRASLSPRSVRGGRLWALAQPPPPPPPPPTTYVSFHQLPNGSGCRGESAPPLDVQQRDGWGSPLLPRFRVRVGSPAALCDTRARKKEEKKNRTLAPSRGRPGRGGGGGRGWRNGARLVCHPPRAYAGTRAPWRPEDDAVGHRGGGYVT